MNDVRVSLNLPEAVVATLKQLAQENGSTMTDVIRRAILTEKMLRDETAAGVKILLQDTDKKLRQLVLR